MITNPPESADSAIEEQLESRLRRLEKQTQADVLTLCAPVKYGVDDLLRHAIEQRFGKRKTRKPKLFVMIETGGGYIEVAQRIVDTIRRHYKRVEFIIPNYAMSAGTVVVLSGDAIHMDYYSILGPIDPQVERNGKMVPALGYLEQFDRLVEKSKNGTLTTGEAAYLIQKFDPAEMYLYEQARQLSISLLKEWLVKYKFKNWKKTARRRMKVTQKMRQNRAEEIASLLNKTDEWHSHGRGISMAILRKKCKLIVDDFATKPAFNDAIQSYYRLLRDYMSKVGHAGVVHVPGWYVPIRYKE